MLLAGRIYKILHAEQSAAGLLVGKRIFQKDAAEALLADMDSAVKVIPTKAKFVTDAQREEVLQTYRDGITKLRRRLSE